MNNKGTKKTVFTLLLVTIAMFGFGYAMVPLYDVFCKLTAKPFVLLKAILRRNTKPIVSLKLGLTQTLMVICLGSSNQTLRL